jgi:hypothetical protein
MHGACQKHGACQCMVPASAWCLPVHGACQCMVPANSWRLPVHGACQCKVPASAWCLPAWCLPVHGACELMAPASACPYLHNSIALATKVPSATKAYQRTKATCISHKGSPSLGCSPTSHEHLDGHEPITYCEREWLHTHQQELETGQAG